MTANTETRRAQASRVDATALARLRAALLAERSALAPLAAEHEATVAELTGQSDVDSILERELAGASIGRTRTAIDDIDAALACIDAGTYGVCEGCGDAIPIERLDAIPGSVPSVTNIPPGCPFHPRCPYAVRGVCDVGSPPPLEPFEQGHDVACVRAREIQAELNKETAA